MFKQLRGFVDDEKGDISIVFKLVLVITIIAAILVILLLVLQKAQVGGGEVTTAMNETVSQLTSNLTSFTPST